MRRWLMDSATIHWDFQKMDLHNYVDKEIAFVRSNDVMKYARVKHTQLNIGRKVRPKYGLGCTTNVRMVIQLAKDLEWTIAHSLQSNRVARSLEFTRHSSNVGIPVENNTRTKEWMKMARSIMISRIIKR